MISELPLRLELESRPGRHRHGLRYDSTSARFVSLRSRRRHDPNP